MTDDLDDALREQARKELANVPAPSPDDRDLPTDVPTGDPEEE